MAGSRKASCSFPGSVAGGRGSRSDGRGGLTLTGPRVEPAISRRQPAWGKLALDEARGNLWSTVPVERC